MRKFNIVLGGKKAMTVKADNGKRYNLPYLSKKEYHKLECARLIGYSSLKLSSIPENKEDNSEIIGLLGYRGEYEDVLISAIKENKKKCNFQKQGGFFVAHISDDGSGREESVAEHTN